jgi:hypothetical protein
MVRYNSREDMLLSGCVCWANVPAKKLCLLLLVKYVCWLVASVG